MTTVISVRFRSGCKTYYFDPKDLTVEAGQDVIVETAQGPEFAQCCEGNHAVPDEQVVPPLRAVLRIATDKTATPPPITGAGRRTPSTSARKRSSSTSWR